MLDLTYSATSAITQLVVVAKSHQIEEITAFLDTQIISVNARDLSGSALFQLCRDDVPDQQAIELLIAAGGDIDDVVMGMASALHFDLVEKYLAQGGTLQAAAQGAFKAGDFTQGMTYLRQGYAIQAKHTHAAHALIPAALNPDISNNALNQAIDEFQPESHHRFALLGLSEQWQALNAFVDSAPKTNRCQLSFLAGQAGRLNDINIIRYAQRNQNELCFALAGAAVVGDLVMIEAILTSQPTLKYHALKFLCQFGHLSPALSLLAAHFNPDETPKALASGLDGAIQAKNDRLIDFFIEQGVSEHDTVTLAIKKGGDLRLIKGALQRSPDLLDAKQFDKDKTLLAMAGQARREDVVRWLLDKGASLSVQGARATSALALCQENSPSYQRIKQALAIRIVTLRYRGNKLNDVQKHTLAGYLNHHRQTANSADELSQLSKQLFATLTAIRHSLYQKGLPIELQLQVLEHIGLTFSQALPSASLAYYRQMLITEFFPDQPAQSAHLSKDWPTGSASITRQHSFLFGKPAVQQAAPAEPEDISVTGPCH